MKAERATRPQQFMQKLQLLNRNDRNGRSAAIRVCTAVCVALVGFSWVSVANAGPVAERRAAAREVAKLLAPAKNRSGLSFFLGGEPAGCIENSATTEICSWELAKKQEAWEQISEIVDTGARINVMCALPLETNATRVDASCTAHPQKSNRSVFQLPGGTSGARRIRELGGSRGMREDYQKVAKAWLRGARTLVAMSREMGALPNSCLPTEGDQKLCVWKTSKRTYGHGTAAMSIGARLSKRVVLRCHFPEDGSPRLEGSCVAEIGD